MIKISPSIIAADQARLGEEVKAITNAGADYIHLDIMDGNFVPNITFGADIVKALRKYSTLPFHVHLMVQNPLPLIDDFVRAGADLIILHVESLIHVERSLQLLKSHQVKCGLSLNPATHENALTYLLSELDLVLVMTVNPGFSGQSFLESQLLKISNLRQAINSLEKNIDLCIDGGINPTTAAKAISCGASSLVAGSYIFSAAAADYQNRIEQLRK